MFERIVSPLVLRRTIIGSEAARVMPKSLERIATRISKIQEISSLFLVCNAIKVVFHTKDSHLVHKNMALGGSLPSVRLRFLEPGNYVVRKQSPRPIVLQHFVNGCLRPFDSRRQYSFLIRRPTSSCCSGRLWGIFI